MKIEMNKGSFEPLYSLTNGDSLIVKMIDSVELSGSITLNIQYMFPIDTVMNREVVLRRENRWYPLQYGDLANVTASATIPVDYRLISVGPVRGKNIEDGLVQWKWTSEKPITTWPIVIFRNNAHRIISQIFDNTDFNFYFYTEDTGIVRQLTEQMPDAYRYFDNLFGKSGFSQVSFIEVSEFPAIQSLPSLLICGSKHLEYFNYTGFGNWPPHEIAHLWFGHGVISAVHLDSKGKWFISESLVEYLRLMYIEETYGKDSLDYEMEYALDFYRPFAGTDKDIPIIEIESLSSPEAAKVIYRKGPLVFHKVREIIGYNKWIALLKQIYTELNGEVLTLEHFKEYLAAYDDQQQAVKMLNQMITEIGMPDE